MDRALTVPAPGGPFRTGFPDHDRQMTMIARSVDPQLGGDLPSRRASIDSSARQPRSRLADTSTGNDEYSGAVCAGVALFGSMSRPAGPRQQCDR